MKRQTQPTTWIAAVLCVTWACTADAAGKRGSKVDGNQDGTVSADELAKTFDRGQGLRDQVFTRLDTDGDGRVSRAEFNNNNPFNFRDTVNVLGAAGGVLTSDATAAFTWLGIATFTGRCNVDTTTSTTAGDFSKDASGNLEYRDASATKKVHVSPSGYFKGYGHSTVDAPAATISVDTDAAVAPIVAATIDVSATAWVQRAAAGDITVSLIEVGVGQIGTSGTITLPAKSGSNFFPINFSRPHAASTTPTVYRFFIDGNASNVNAVTTKITAEPGSSA